MEAGAKKTTQIAMFARTFIRGGFFFIFIRFTATRCIPTLLLFFFHCWLFHVCATISTVRPTFSPGDTQTHTHIEEWESFMQFHFMSYHILFVYMIVCLRFSCLARLPDTHSHTHTHTGITKIYTEISFVIFSQKLSHASHFTKSANGCTERLYPMLFQC